MSTCAILSFRLGMTDGVSVAARHWAIALERLGFDVVTVAGEGPVQVRVPGLAIDAPEPPRRQQLESALAGADLVVVENVLSLPLNLPAARSVAEVLRGRPALLHHHDLPWQRRRFASVSELPPDDPAWRHVTVNEMTRNQMRQRRIEATCIYNGFDTAAPEGDRSGTRERIGAHPGERVVAHPVRAIPRKNIAGAVKLCEALGATYWLLGAAEDGYGPELEAVLAGARCRVIRHELTGTPDIYAASDFVAFPSLWEGFGNPPIEAAIWRRGVAVGPYPVGAELRALGFEWFDYLDVEGIAAFLSDPDREMLEHNRELAIEHFSLERLEARIRSLLADAGWLP